jgi:DivIVA domain-containing protein
LVPPSSASGTSRETYFFEETSSMIDLTPLDVRKKREDFRKILRGYDPEEVDTFLGLVSERFEELVKENMTLRERSERLQEQVRSQLERERAVQEALVTAQELRDEIRGQAQREAEEIRGGGERQAELVRREAEADAGRIVEEARRQLEQRTDALEDLERRRVRFLRSFRALLEREMDVVEIEEGRTPLQDIELDMVFQGGATGREPRAVPDSDASSSSESSDPPGDDPAAAASRPPDGESPTDGPREEASDADGHDPEALKSGDVLHEGPSEDDPKRWLSSLVERELNEKPDEDSWG